MNDRELLEFIATKVAELDAKVGSLDAKVGSLDTKVADLDAKVGNLANDVSGLKNDVSGLKDGQKRIEIALEHDIKPKIETLFDGYKQHTDQLDRIEKEVSRHDEFILRRIK